MPMSAVVCLGYVGLPPGRDGDRGVRVLPGTTASKLATLTWWADTTLGADLGAGPVSTDDIYASMDWLLHQQDAIEAQLAARSRSASSTATPAIPPGSPRSSRWCGRGSGWPRWSWSGTGA